MQEPTEDLPDTLQQLVDTAVASYVRSPNNAGLVVGVIRDGERRVFGYGKPANEADGDPVPPDGETLFEIGSISKAFTGTLLAETAQRGEVQLSDPVGRFLPDSARMPGGADQSITLEQLASHSSGLPRLPDNLSDTLQDRENPYAHYTPEHLYQFLARYRLRRAPGSQYEYSSLGAGVLGHALGRALGRGYEAAVVELLCDPLGMSDTRIVLSDGQLRRLAPGHSSRGRPVPGWDVPVLAGAGALRSSANDMLVFLAAQLGRATAPLSEAIEETHRVRQRTPDPLVSVRRYGFALLVLVAAVAAWGLLPGLFHREYHHLITLLLFAVALSGWYGGLGAALLADLLGVLVLDYLWPRPPATLGIGSTFEGGWLARLAFMGAGIAWFTSGAHRAARRTAVGLGWHVRPLGARKMHWHNGGTGGFRSFAGLVKETGTAVVVLSNSANSVDDIGLRILRGLNE